MTVRQISIEAYRKHQETGKALTQWQTIYRKLSYYMRPRTRSEISEDLNMRLSSVCGRVNELIKAKMITEFPRRKCSITGEPAHPVGIPLGQGELF